jgi:hypothetical protein
MKQMQIINQGSLVLFKPVTDFAKEWWADNVDTNAMMSGSFYVVEHRYANDIIEGFLNDGGH